MDNIKLLQCSGLDIADKAIGKCWDKVKSEVDLERINRIVKQYQHTSTIEHLVYTFDIEGISRACLQELVRHRIASYSVKSTRYTLRELKAAKDLTNYFVDSGDIDVDWEVYNQLKKLQGLLNSRSISNDVAKYMLPEAFKTSLVMTINARSLMNFLKLRTSKRALREIQEVAKEMFRVLPKEHKFLFEDLIEGDK